MIFLVKYIFLFINKIGNHLFFLALEGAVAGVTGGSK